MKFLKRKQTRILGALAVLALASVAVAAASGALDISWFSISGGGGQSTGGRYELTGSVAQGGAGTMSGGSYTLETGFMSANK